MNNHKKCIEDSAEQRYFLPLSFVAVACILATSVLTGCNPKAFTKPRSQIVEEAESEGIFMPTVEEERSAFYGEDEQHKSRLIALLKDRAAGAIRDSSYRIGAGDELEINVFDVPELNVTTKVLQSGFIRLPLVGAVKASDLTEQEFHEELEKRLGQYVKNPQINITISQYGSQKVAVMGAVRTPGTYSIKKGANSILELLSEAGGVTERAGSFINFIPAEYSGIASNNNVEARARLALAASDPSAVAGHAQGGGIQVYIDRVLGTNGGIPLEIPVRGGDMIIVPDAGKAMLEGEVQKAGAVDLNSRATLLGALASAGGVTYSAKFDEIEIVREVGQDKKAHLVLDLSKIANGEEQDIKLKDGDLIRVPSDSGRRMRSDTFDGISRVINFGVGGSVNLVP